MVGVSLDLSVMQPIPHRATFMKTLPCLVLAALLFTLPAAAQLTEDYKDARRLVDAGIILPLDVIIMQARRTGMTGRVLDVSFLTLKGRYIYVVNVLDNNGDIHEVVFDASNGDVLDIYEAE